MEDFTGAPVNIPLLNQYDKQKHRGQQGFGLYDGSHDNLVRESKEDSILKWLVKYDSPLLLMHHRFPTSTINVKRAAHPFTTKDYFNKTKRKRDKVEYILVHNGVIRNAYELYEKHFTGRDIEYQSVLEDATFNDSEALLWDFALTMEGKQEKLTAEGSIAFICLKLVAGKLSKMYFARNYGSPLRMKRTPEGISLASELEEGETVDTNTLYTWNYKLHRLTKRDFKVPDGYTAYNTGYSSGYKYDNACNQDLTYHSSAYDCDCNDFGWEACKLHGIWDDDFDSYSIRKRVADNEKRMGEKIGNVLTREFGDKFGWGKQTAPLVGEVISPQQRSLAINKENEITEEDVAKEVMIYLTSVNGNFESAYWSMEGDYSILEEEPISKSVVKQMHLLELAINHISSDPEWINDKSVSSVWEQSWKKLIA